MESLFKKIASLSATTILLLLTSIFVVLFIYAKPAIVEYGLNFITDPRWGVEVPINQPNSDKQIKQNNVKKQQVVTNDDGVNMGEDDDIGAISTDNVNVAKDDDVVVNNGGVNVADDDDIGINVGGDDDIPAPTIQAPKTKTIYGGLVPIVGTILSTILAMFFAVPLAMGIAIFLSEIAPEFIAKPVGIAIELLAAIPSIIYGMWGLFYFGPFISHLFGGSSVSLLVAGLVLAIMIVPFMASLTRDSMNTTPAVLKESAYAMGATKFEVIKDVIFPYAKKGIIGSMILALGRALGETMAVAFVIGGVFTFPKSITDPTVSIPVVLANSFSESNGMSLNVLFYLALVLFIISFIVISFAKFYFLRDKK
jgi:phosphate transport system permease protein